MSTTATAAVETPILQRTLNLTEIFLSIQGETTFSGLPTTFIRLAGCPLRCSWCDTSYSFAKGDNRSIESILTTARANHAKQICVTGGEPLIQPSVFPLMQALCDEGFSLSLETSGAFSIAEVDPRVSVILDIKCPGSGMVMRNKWENLLLLKAKDQVKFVIANEQDYLWAKIICQEHSLWDKGCEILLSPVHGELATNLLVEWILRDHLPVRLNVQIHKHIWSPETKGV
jgi:7-carboxy-7-deazaguanine synthase